ncbi:MAG: thiamine phosphate synthase [Pseudomonadota bacterium]
MASQDAPQLYLITPPEIELSRFPATLDEVLGVHSVACIRLALSSTDPDLIARATDAVREVAHARDVALVIEAHVAMAERLGLDGVHLTDGARSVRSARAALGPDAIVGAFCGASRHDGMTAGEAGADYVSFGPVRDTGLGAGGIAESDLFAWWSEMIEVPVVAEGALTGTEVSVLWDKADFLGFGSEIWDEADPLAALTALLPPG